MDKPKLYLEDLHIGRRFHSGKLRLEEDRLKAFAAEFDPQPFHLDEEAARHTLFRGLAASGWHTAALSMRLLVDSDLVLAGGLVGLGGELQWPRPARPGDTLQVESEVLEIIPSRSKPNQAIVKFRNTTTNQDGEAVQIFTVSILAYRRPTGPV